jgi:hypothetical protein
MGIHIEAEDRGRGAPLLALMRSLGAAGRRHPSGALPTLAATYPGQPLGGRWVGLQAVPTSCIRGTASLTTPTSRGIDFRPLKGREPADWKGRWDRLESALEAQLVLPPVDLVRAGGEYWVVDGHNRVAIAKERGQLWIDADITELDLPEPDIAGLGLGPDELAARAA